MSDEQRVIRPGVQYITPGRMMPAMGKESLEFYDMMGMLRDVRAEVQNLQKALQDVISREELTDTATRTREVLVTIREYQPIYDYNGGEIEIRLGELRSLMRSYPMLYDYYGDEVAHIENAWERATYEWPHFTTVKILAEDAENGEALLDADGLPTGEAAQLAAAEVLRSAKKTNDHLNKIVYHTGLITIPNRLNQHLDQLRIGQALDFNGTFIDEVPNAEDRRRILEYLSLRPVAVENGIIDMGNEVIFRASPDAGRRRMSYMYIFLTVVLGFIITYAFSEIGEVFTLENWPIAPGQTTNLLIGYVFIIIGGIVHLGIDALKQARNYRAQSTFLAVDDWFTWVHINEVAIIIGVVSLWVGFFGVVLLNGTIGWEAAFLVGYSIDSFVDVFLQRFNVAASAKAAKVIPI